MSGLSEEEEEEDEEMPVLNLKVRFTSFSFENVFHFRGSLIASHRCLVLDVCVPLRRGASDVFHDGFLL